MNENLHCNPSFCNQEDFDFLNNNIENCCGSEGPNSTLCKIKNVADIMSQKPLSCLIDLINNYMNCGQQLTQDQKNAAYQVFSTITNNAPINFNQVFETLRTQQISNTDYYSLYIFFPITFLMLVLILVMAIFKWINWIVAIFLMMFVILVFYGFSVLFRINSYKKLNI